MFRRRRHIIDLSQHRIIMSQIITIKRQLSFVFMLFNYVSKQLRNVLPLISTSMTWLIIIYVNVVQLCLKTQKSVLLLL